MKHVRISGLLLLIVSGCVTTPEPPVVATFSIAAHDPETGELGVAVQSRFIAVGSVVPWAKAGVGAVATQAWANTTYGPEGLELLEKGMSPDDVLVELLKKDPERERRQVGIVNAKGETATFTGRRCQDWAGGLAERNFCVQGNILAGKDVVGEMARAFRETEGDLGERMLAALAAGQAAGGDRRGKQSAALYIVREKGGYSGFNDRYRDLRVDDHKEPIQELLRIYRLHKKVFPPPRKPEKPLFSIDAAGIRSDLGYLASDELEGRLATEEGAEKAAKHIEAGFRKAGLAPPAGMKTHRQEFEFRPRTHRQMGGLGPGGARGANIVAFFEGSDPKLKNTVVILGAHYDHAGRTGQESDPGRLGRPEEDDDIWNGANDNASGTSALLAIARALGSGRIKTRRSILLIAFAAEEQGLLGSRYYCANPVVPLDRTLAMVNLDSIGRLREQKDRHLQVYQVRTSRAWIGLIEPLAKKHGLACDFHERVSVPGTSSDHAPFGAKRVPSVLLFTGIMPERHRVTDEADTIDYEGISKIAGMALELAARLADRTNPLPD